MCCINLCFFNRQFKHLRNRRGAVLMLSALLIPTVIGSLGLAVDIGNVQLNQMKVTSALDASAISGVLNATTGSSEPAAENVAMNVGNFNLKRGGLDGSVQVDVKRSPSGSTRVEAQGVGIHVPVYFLGILKPASVHDGKIRLDHVMAAAERTPALVAIVLDNSASMQGNKLIELKKAAKSFVDIFDLAMDRVAIIGFGDQAKIYYSMPSLNAQLDDQNEKSIVYQAIDRMVAKGETNISEGMTIGRREIERVFYDPNGGYQSIPTIRAMVLVSDGAPTVFRGNFRDIQTIHPLTQGTPTYAAHHWSPWHLKDLNEYLRADANSDGVVNEQDVHIWFGNMGKTVSGGKRDGDFDWNGKVDWGNDVQIIIRSYNMPAPSAPPTSLWTVKTEAIDSSDKKYYKIVQHPNNDPSNAGQSSYWPELGAKPGTGFDQVISAWRPLDLNKGSIYTSPDMDWGYNYLVRKSFEIWSNRDPDDTSKIRPACSDNPYRFPLLTEWGSNYFGKSPLRDCLKGLANYDSKGNLHDDLKPDLAKEVSYWSPLRYNNTQGSPRNGMPHLYHYPYYAAIREADLAKLKRDLGGTGIQIYAIGIGLSDYRGADTFTTGCFEAQTVNRNGKMIPAPTKNVAEATERCGAFTSGSSSGTTPTYSTSQGAQTS